jgi:hypothetical protein
MGYMGQEHWTDSDLAADLYGTVVEALLKKLTLGLEEDANDINTSGPVNVALIIESGLLDTIPNDFIEEHFKYDKLIKGLEKLIKESSADKKKQWEDEGNRLEHHNAYKRMLKNVKAWYPGNREG